MPSTSRRGFRPLPESGLAKFSEWIKSEKWESVLRATTAHQKAQLLHNMMMENLEKCLPLKTIKICSEDEPWFNPKNGLYLMQPTQHYLIKMVDRILTSLDSNNSNEAYAVITHLIDWTH
jgi:hypothetical protein